MGEFLNHNSFLMLVAVIWLAAAAVLLRKGRGWRSWLVMGGISVALLLGYSALRPAAATNGDADALRARIGAGQPVLLEFQSQN